MTVKNINLKEKFKQALISTAKAISGDLKLENNDETKILKNTNFVDIEKLNSKNDFIKARAESDSSALKEKFSSSQIYKKNLPSNNSCKSLYLIAEKIRYESLGCRMLKGIEKNLKQNYDQKSHHSIFKDNKVYFFCCPFSEPIHIIISCQCDVKISKCIVFSSRTAVITC